MRVIVACSQCKRQYKATGKKPGSRFRCLCGATLTIEQPKGHDARVVRCSSCGAPREKEASACAHCGADFTIHEQDMHTVCPNCLATVSDRAKFCHHCATRLMPESVVGEQSEHTCPVCGPEAFLRSRRLAGRDIAVLECELCAGLWLGLQSFQALLEFEEENPHPASSHPKPAASEQSGPRYRECVVCKQLMQRRNFGQGKSGVIVDLCGKHGIWFDADELSQLIAWVRGGNVEAALTDMARLSSSTDRLRRQKAIEQLRPKPKEPRRVARDPFNQFAPGEEDPFDEIADMAIAVIGRLFRRS